VKLIGLAVISLALWAAGPTWAQGDSVFLESAPANRLSSKLPGLAVRHLSHRASGPECPENVLELDFFYPQGFGRPEIDEAVAATITAKFEEWLADDGPFCDRELCGSASCGLWAVEKTFAVYTPSSDFISILFTEESYTGGAHVNLDFDVMNFSLKNDRPMVLTDLFPRPEESVPLYWAHVYAEWCRAQGIAFPPHFVNESLNLPPGEFFCQRLAEEITPPEEFLNTDALEGLSRLIFTSRGATLLLGPYESGSYASGTQALDISKETLAKMGANPALWRD
jgi:hypothetical protein